MSLLRLLLNILWILTGGFWMAVAWLVAAMLMAITIIGLPWARAAFNIASYCTAPGFSDTRQRYAAACVVIVAAIQCRRVSAGLR